MQPDQVLTFLAIYLIMTAALLAGCTTPQQITGSGSVQVVSFPQGAEIYIDNEYHGTTPGTITAVPAGNHTVEVRERGYDHRFVPVMVTAGGTAHINVTLILVPAIMSVTISTTTPSVDTSLPQIHIDGYWTLPQSGSTGNPAPLLVHTEAFNVGTTDAREVTVSANMYYEGRQICWNTIYLGTLKTGGHVTKDSMVACPLPSSLNNGDLTIRFENVVVIP